MMDSTIIQKLDPVIDEVYKKTGISIQNFKPTFLERRIMYRMRSIGISDYEEYLRTLSSDFDEAKSLYAAFSINVTRFFRDPLVWEKLENEILPNLVKNNENPSIRAWSCGSASGEEPHSISILLDEFSKSKIKYHVYATDINNEGIIHSKKGIYEKTNLENVSSSRMLKYFLKDENQKFNVKQEIKNKIEFEKIDMLKTNRKLFDIIFCRNVLIYYPKEVHQKIYEKFFEALKPNGILILGQDESMRGTNGSNFFELLFPKERIYQKISK